MSLEAARSTWLIALFRLFVALCLLWLGTLGPTGWIVPSASLAAYQFVSVGYLVFALLLAVLARDAQHATPIHLEYQGVVGTLGDILGVGFVLLTAGGVDSGLGLLLIPLVAASATVTRGRIALLMAAIATLMLLVTELFVGPRLPWPFEPHPTQTGLLGATMFGAMILVWRLTLRAGTSEARLAQQQQNLAKLAEINERVIAQMETGVIAADPSGRIQNINAAARKLLEPGDGDTLRSLSPPLDAAVRRWLAGPALPETLRIAGAPDRRSLEVRMAPLGGSAEQGTLMILEDAAEIRRRSHAGKLQALGRLTASIAHEIRNPLGAISHSAQLLAESPQVEGANRRLLEIIQNQSLRVDGLIRSVLSLSRGQPTARERLPLQERLRGFAEDFCRANQDARDALHIEVHPEDTEVLFDPAQFSQVLWNLCGNACLHAGHQAPGSGPIVLRGRADNRNRGVTLDVIDSGPGIPPEQQESLFEPFSSGAPGSTGLGLYISRLLCENNGAALEYVQQPRGGCFRILFAPPTEDSEGARPESP
jgi:two-component system, NtrC family, sensor histidine kinase PilS